MRYMFFLTISEAHLFLTFETFFSLQFSVVALMAIKMELNDPYNVLENWDVNSVDPCSWRMVTCSADGYVSAL